MAIGYYVCIILYSVIYLLEFIYLLVCLLCVYACVCAHPWTPKENLWELGLSCFEGLRDQTQVKVRLGVSCLYLLSYLIGPLYSNHLKLTDIF